MTAAPPAGTLELFDNDVPPIGGGDYVITVTHTADAIAPAIPPATQAITLVAPQVTLDQAEVLQCSPPPTATGQFGDVLASVLLAEPSLPWERTMPAKGCPWLALLVFAEGELSGGDPGTGLTATTFAKYQAITDAVVPPIALEKDVDTDQAVTYIRVPSTVFTQVTPRADELPWLAHVRRATPAGGTPTDVSVVMANRFPPLPPEGATAPARAIAHLVSVEGLTPWLVDAPAFTASGTQDGTQTYDSVVLLSLASWSFAVVPDPAESFQGLTLALQDAEYDPQAKAHAPRNLALTLPLPPGYPADASDPGQAEVAARVEAGYVPLTYHARSGEDAMAWYRGPVTPQLIAALDPPVPFRTADDALIYDTAHGVFDVSLASAWQIGRAAALGDRAFGQALYSYRQAVQQLGDVVVDQMARAQFPDHPGAPDDTAMTTSALAAIKSLLHTGPDAPADGDGGSGDRKLTWAQVAPAGMALLEALQDPRVVAAVEALVDDALLPVADWLAGLQLVEPLPFTCLVPDARMLPRATPPAGNPEGDPLPGAIRFGYLDPNWTSAMLDGALSLAVESSRQAAAAGALDPTIRKAVAAALQRRCGLAEPPTGPVSVLLLRSDLVSGWPTLAVTPLDGSGQPTIPVLRMDRLAPGVLLALFDGIPASVRIAEPHQALTLGVDEQGATELRNLRPPGQSSDPAVGHALGVTAPILTTATCLRGDGSARVLAVTATGGLVATITQALQQQGQATTAFGPAALALQLVRAPQAMAFDSAGGS